MELTQDFADKRMREHWAAFLDQIESGEMPPEGKPHPPAVRIKSATSWISEQVIAADSSDHKEQGRVGMRRLNRAEYANTVRDLLGVEVDLTDLLPTDTGANDFDKNAELLHTSSHLMRSKLDAADRVLNAAIANHGLPWQVNRRLDLKEERELEKDRVCKLLEEGLSIFAVWESPNIRLTMWNFRSPISREVPPQYLRFRSSKQRKASELPYEDGHTEGSDREATHRPLRGAQRLTDGDLVHGAVGAENRLRMIADQWLALRSQFKKQDSENYKVQAS